HFLSMNIDKIWRRKSIRLLKSEKPQLILDVATGTGDFAFEIYKRLKPKKIIGIDISEGMLKVGEEKIKKRNLTEYIEFRKGDSENLDFEDNYFDAVTVAFGVRNFENLQKGLAELFRVLKPSGNLIVLEFSQPDKFPIKQLYGLYSKYILPFFGKLFSKDKSAYIYLPESVNAFPYGEKFIQFLKNAGFKSAQYKKFSFGISSVYFAEK
ncbi:MAG: bifunctional demethylmenaquinone methyltransferase/2-methoxy-6-polyprenyl-1,4-benzoquinol methylase UbiE, partial [Bacteroidales bacterium]|nr:bifunctional demethylmenaquinone methyltransferase/2-methoxy-6-polyprenyl-1,4-benzoquinol methylase UbiE [Bacteroidales bacterium]